MKICPRHFGVWDMACKHGCVTHCVLARPELVNAQAARWEWARSILAGDNLPLAKARAVELAMGLMRDEPIESIVDNAIAKEERSNDT